jgi:phytol kinase
MLLTFLAVAVVLLLLLLSELLWRKRHVNPELTRKFAHITIGTFVAFWPFFLSWNQIKILSLAFLVVVLLSQYFKIFQAIHSVQRPTWGEIFFAVAVGALAFMVPSDHKGIYVAALLQMSLADGFAAVLGTLYGKNNRYEILSYPKSMVGTLAFFALSLAILLGYVWFSGAVMPIWHALALAIGATALENIFVRGLDNLAIPLFVAILLK